MPNAKWEVQFVLYGGLALLIIELVKRGSLAGAWGKIWNG